VTSQQVYVSAFLAKYTVSWAPTQRAVFLIHVFLETMLISSSLEPLIGFVAYLEPKLWNKNSILDQN